MLETNKEYKAITALKKTISNAEATQSRLDELKQKKEKLENVTMNPEHKFFPYGQTLLQIDKDGQRSTVLKIIVHTLYLLVPYGLLFILPLIAIYGMDRFDLLDMDLFFTESSYQFVLIGVYAALMVITVLTVFKYSKRIWRGQTKRRFNRVRASMHDKLSESLEESESQIKDFNDILQARIEALNKDIEALNEKLVTLHQKIEDNTMVPKKFIPDIPIILEYFEDNRVKNIKDAINLLISERRQNQMFETIQANQDEQTQTLKELVEVMRSIESFEQKIAEQPVQQEETYESDEARVLDAKLKAARTKKERKKLEKKKKKLEKKQNT